MGEKSKSEFIMFKDIVIPLLTEFTAQFFHTYWGVMSSPPYVPPTEGNSNTTTPEGNNYFQGVFVPAIQAGLSVWMQIVVFWKISVAHFNPAISMGFLITGHLKPIMFVPYVAAQCLGSIVAALIAKAILEADPAVVLVPDDASSAAVFFNEFIITGILVFFAVAMVVDKSYDQPTGPMAIGLTIFQGILSAQWVGVACLSPSRAIGPAVATGGAAWNRHWLLWLADLAGAAFAASYYMLMFAPNKQCWFMKLKRKSMSRSMKHDHRTENVLIEKSLERGTNL